MVGYLKTFCTEFLLFVYRLCTAKWLMFQIIKFTVRKKEKNNVFSSSPLIVLDIIAKIYRPNSFGRTAQQWYFTWKITEPLRTLNLQYFSIRQLKNICLYNFFSIYSAIYFFYNKIKKKKSYIRISRIRRLKSPNLK